MRLPFSDTNAVPFVDPTLHSGKRPTTIAAQASSSTLAHSNVNLDFNQKIHSEVNQSPLPALDNTMLDKAASDKAASDKAASDKAALDKAEPLEVVKQAIDDLEAQGLLMLFDRHDHVAKRLTGDLIAAGVLQEEPPLCESGEYDECNECGDR